jgi:hypothetical protein
MAGGVNPFGFSMGVLPAPRAPRQPKDLPSAPFGFAPPPSKWDKTKDILAPYVTGPINAWEGLRKTPLHILLGGGTQEQQEEVAGNSFNVAGNLAGASSFVSKPKNALNMGIRAFHGSPHDFPPVRLIEMPDGQRLYQNMNELAETPQGARIIQEFPLGRFDMSKIGTGEGAQAYGHGLYFAEREGVARAYRDALSRQTSYDGQLVGNMHPSDSDAAAAISSIAKHVADGVDPGEAMRLEAVKWRQSAEPYIRFANENPEHAARALESAKSFTRVADEIERLDPQKFSQNPGRMYEVEINADPDTFLDWDKPLSEQPEAVRRMAGWTPEAEAQYRAAMSSDTDNLMAALEGDAQYSPQKLPRPPGTFPMDSTGAQFYESSKLVPGDYRDKVAAAEKLKQAGIPGIKYLDAGSRGAGDGTRNYVVFDENLISIVRKYGIAGASAMLGYNILDGVDPAQAEELKRIEGNQ